MEEFYYKITQSGIRVDRYLAQVLPDISRSQIQKLIGEDHLLVNGRKVKASFVLKEGDEVEFELPEAENLSLEPQDLNLEILYEDEDLAVIYKPLGMVVHPAPGHSSGTLVNGLLFALSNLSSVNGVIRPGIVHRIDKDTSGILVVAKNDKAHQGLSQQLADHSMVREYTALAEGIFKELEGTVDAPLGRDPKNRLRMAIVANGRRAVTHYRVKEFFLRHTLLNLRLETGRTHQIRVHLKSLHHPIACDPVYGFKHSKLGYPGQMLHAGVLGFIHPRTGHYLEFSAPLPEAYETILAKLRREREANGGK